MRNTERAIAALGNEPPVVGDGRSGPPDRREVSARWLSGTFLTGITSSVLMGVALLAALDGHEQLATPPEVANLDALEASGPNAESKAPRVISPRTISRARDRRRMEVSTMISDGDRNLVRTLPFEHVKMALAAGHTTNRDYPPFDPLAVFAEDGAVRTANTGLIYGAKVESEVSLRTIDFPIETAAFDGASDLTAGEVEEVVRITGSVLTDGAVQVAALHYVNPERFGQPSLAVRALGASYGVRIVPENVTVAQRRDSDEQVVEFAEDIIPFRSDREILDAFLESGYSEGDVAGMTEALTKLLGGSRLRAGTVLRVGIETRGDRSRIVRSSIYSGRDHLLSIAVDDRGQFVPGDEPEPNPEVLTAFDDSPPVHVRGDLPSVYDGIYRAAYSYGLTKDMTRQMVRLLASDVDYQSRLNPSDRIEVFFSNPQEDGGASEDSELLYVAATFNGTTRNFYRFQMEDDTIDYFDKDGRSARQFLLRNPVPGARLSRGFGMMRHPILGYSKMHTGVDWAIANGTPIIAAGNGTVEEAGWSGGYGRHTVIRHANGYETSYSHQSAIAKDVTEGAKVRQGQIIGYVGSSGLSTGNHLHYELMVNGTKVDPMRVRLPVGRVLKDKELEAFTRERERIDELLKEDTSPPLKMASATN
jgi:murein DD-endopeptidase MepM/ murein hydrolase activator NlpD